MSIRSAVLCIAQCAARSNPSSVVQDEPRWWGEHAQSAASSRRGRRIASVRVRLQSLFIQSYETSMKPL
jgi:hypothetical protein